MWEVERDLARRECRCGEVWKGVWLGVEWLGVLDIYSNLCK